MQRAKYDIGEQAVHRFALSAEDKATLELAEWVDNAFKRTLVYFVLLHHSACITLYESTSRIMGLEYFDMRPLSLSLRIVYCILFLCSCYWSLGMHLIVFIGCCLVSLKLIIVLSKFRLILFQRISHLVNNLD